MSPCDRSPRRTRLVPDARLAALAALVLAAVAGCGGRPAGAEADGGLKICVPGVSW